MKSQIHFYFLGSLDEMLEVKLDALTVPKQVETDQAKGTNRVSKCPLYHQWKQHI